MTDLRYPIGPFELPERLDDDARRAAIGEIAAAPGALRAAVAGLTDPQLDTPYRDGGWTVRQVVHHVPDSHLNAWMRMKLCLTEARPVIRPYEEARWARLADYGQPVGVSLDLLDALHRRWVPLMEALTEIEWDRHYVHPEDGDRRLYQLLALYAWHGRHHTAHITGLRERMGW